MIVTFLRRIKLILNNVLTGSVTYGIDLGPVLLFNSEMSSEMILFPLTTVKNAIT